MKYRHSILNVLSMLKILPDILSKYMLNLLMKSVSCIQKNGQTKTIAMLNHTHQVLYLHLTIIIFSRWIWLYRVIPSLLKIIAVSLMLLSGFFFLVTASFELAVHDTTL